MAIGQRLWGRLGRTGGTTLVLAAAALAWTLQRLLAIGTRTFHWDEFALMRMTARTAETGILATGGRPGLVTLALMPLVEGCGDEIAVLLRARWLWLGVTIAGLVALGACVAMVRGADRRRGADAALAVAMVALLPVFLATSVQVRTDQVAVALGLWGGVALLASRRDARIALLAGLAYGAGFLASQKLLYVAALTGALALADLARRRERPLLQELPRLVFTAAAGGAVVAGFYGATPGWLETNRSLSASGVGLSVGQHLDMFAFYRKTIGWSQYREVWPTLLTHYGVVAVLLATTAVRAARRERLGVPLVAAWACLGLGLVVALAHASAFAYFWMVLALFPAAAAGAGLGAARETLAPLAPRAWRGVVAALWLGLLVPAVPALWAQLHDAQAGQRQSLAFVHANFEPDDAGFQPEGVLFCGGPTRDFGIFFSYQLYQWFGADPERREANIEHLLRDFSEREVKFLLGTWRFRQFPEEVRRFWSEHFQPYKDSVYVAGRRFEPRAGTERPFEVLVPGDYRWLAAPGSAPVSLDGRPLRPGERVRLDAGRHELRFAQDQEQAFLVLALNEPPGPAMRPFYEGYR